MDLRSLNIFIEAAELGSFTQAGEKLGYSQPTVSFQIKLLEKELGVQLFDRIGHTVSLTDEGREALAYAQTIWHTSREMLQGSANRRQPSGVLRLAMSDSLCEPLIVGRFRQFRAAYPKVSLHITTGDTAQLLEYLDHNKADMVCAVDERVYDANYCIADEEPIGVHFVTGPESEFAGRALVMADLLEQPFLLTEKDMSYRRVLEERLAAEARQIHPVLETGRADLLCALAQENAGVAFLPDYVTEAAVRDGRLVRLQVQDLQVQVWKQVLYRREKWVSLQMRAMIDHLSAFRLSPGEDGR